MSKKIGIIGAGVAGLACGTELKKLGHEVKIFESSNSVGGRIKTDKEDGFFFDQGFQVFLPSYEKARYFLDYNKLDLKKFASGAKIQKESESEFEILSDPSKHPSKVFSMLKNTTLSFKDKLLVLKLKKEAKVKNEIFLNETMTLEFLKNYDFSEKALNSFFKPFFAGVFLDSELNVSKDFFLYLFNKFSSSQASLPGEGMCAIPNMMSQGFSDQELSLSNNVISIGSKSIISEKDAVESFDKIVLAVSVDKAVNFLDMGNSFSSSCFGMSTYYYKTTSKKFASKYLYLAKGKHVNHIACLTAVNSNYAPKGEHLFSVNVVGSKRIDSRFVTEDLKNIFSQEEIKKWDYLKAYHINKALPKKPLYGTFNSSIKDVFIVGDFMESPSIQGALLSGYKGAHRVHES